jgi:hypothetical protein
VRTKGGDARGGILSVAVGGGEDESTVSRTHPCGGALGDARLAAVKKDAEPVSVGAGEERLGKINARDLRGKRRAAQTGGKKAPAPVGEQKVGVKEERFERSVPLGACGDGCPGSEDGKGGSFARLCVYVIEGVLRFSVKIRKSQDRLVREGRVFFKKMRHFCSFSRIGARFLPKTIDIFPFL